MSAPYFIPYHNYTSPLITSSIRPLLPIPSVCLYPSRLPLPLQTNLVRLCAVVHERLLEPRVLERFFGGDAFLGVVDEDAAEEVEELAVEVGVAWYCFLGER